MSFERKGFAKSFTSALEVAQKYFAILSILNDLKLTKKEIELLAYTSIKGTISPKPAKDGFVHLFKSSYATLNNLISRLQRQKLMYKDGGYKIRVNPKIKSDIEKNRGMLIMIKMDIHGVNDNGPQG